MKTLYVVAHFGKSVADSQRVLQERSSGVISLCLPPSSERETENMASPPHLLVSLFPRGVAGNG